MNISKLFAFATLSASIGCAPTPQVGSAQSAIIGGQPETGYANVGYLLRGPNVNSLYGPVCGATAIASNVVVTAAHCLTDLNKGERAAFVMGDQSAGNHAYFSSKIFLNPLYN